MSGRTIIKWSARVLLIAFLLAVNIFCAAIVGVILGHLGVSKFNQGVGFTLSLMALPRVLMFLTDHAILRDDPA